MPKAPHHHDGRRFWIVVRADVPSHGGGAQDSFGGGGCRRHVPAIFATPFAAVLLAVELLLFEWKPRSMIPVAVASAVADAVRVHLMGYRPIFPVAATHFPLRIRWDLPFWWGWRSGLDGALTTAVYFFEDLFSKFKLHWMWRPAIGGLVVGIGGYFDPRVLGVGYANIHALLKGAIPAASAAKLLTDKALIWAVALGSGTSGRVLAPLLIIGGAMGAIESAWLPGDPVLDAGQRQLIVAYVY